MRFAVIDAETDPFAHGADIAPFVWGFYDGAIYERFDSTQALVSFLVEQDCLVYAHNGGKFDYHFLLPWIAPGQEILVINGRIAKVMLGKAELRDSYNILPVPLKAYQKEDFDYNILTKEKRYLPGNYEKICTYLKSDCVNLWKIVSAFIDKYGPVISQASAAITALGESIDRRTPKSTPGFFTAFQPWYFGGRVQCFKTGWKREDFSVYDIRSAYPFAMLSPHPFGTGYTTVKRFRLDSCYESPQSLYKIHCISHKGAFPWREKIGAKLIFPTDNMAREYHVTGWELRAALNHDAIKKPIVLSRTDFHDVQHFADFILPAYSARKRISDSPLEADIAESLLLKLRMNSAYGKFGANPSEYTRNVLFPLDALGALKGWKDANGIEHGAQFEGREYRAAHDTVLGNCLLGSRPLDRHEQRFYNVATAASITGFVRAFLWESMQTCDGVIYCDTDSIVCRNGDGLKIGKNLGDFNKEGNFNAWYIGGRKLYALESHEPETVNSLISKGAFHTPDKKTAYKIASKGARLLPDEIKKIARGGSVDYYRDAPTFSLAHGMRYTKRTIKATE